jgi:type I restriction enzyme M protein
LSEDLLRHYAAKPLIDQYDIYQQLLDYWTDTMQDDVYLIAADGWIAETTRIVEVDKKGKEKDKGWNCDLVPKALVIAHYFAKRQSDADDLAAQLEEITAALVNLEEENSSDEGAFAQLEAITYARVSERLKEVAVNEAEAETAVLKQWIASSVKYAETKKRLRNTENDVDANALARYPSLTKDEIQTLVVNDKWLTTLEGAIRHEIDRVSQQLTFKINELADRYGVQLSQLLTQSADAEARVAGHLEQMGFSWS